MTDPAVDSNRLHDLISRHTDGLITPEEHAELAAALAADPEARGVWFLRNDIDLALASKAAERRDKLLVPEAVLAPAGVASKRSRAAGLAGAALAAAGVAVGVFGASAVWALTVPWTGQSDTTIPVFSESFEHGASKTVAGLPRGVADPDGDIWRGDDALVTAASQKVDPIAGGRMLRFLRSTHDGENSPKSAWSDVYRFVDARPYLVLADRQTVTARLAASFALSPDACAEGEAYSASVRLYAFDRDISDSPEPLSLGWVLENCVASGMKKVPLTCGRPGWQRVSVDASLPADAKYVLLHVSAVRDEPKPTSEPAVFRGHFVDDVSLELHARKPLR
ncbi:MAG: hypothetical protein RLZZ111_837 [Planctomycetota bacterium]|jgi:hypothetical protein